MKIAAVVVTFNRLELLKDAIRSLREQTRKPDEIIVVNNGSTDETLGWLNLQNDLTIINQENSGSAGGQYTGIKSSYEKGHDWFWCMDDDVELKPDCLEELLNAISFLRSKNIEPGYLSSKVVGFNNEIMNTPLINTTPGPTSYPVWNKFLEEGLVMLAAGTFVSVLINRIAVQKVGYPIKEMFIWGDDYEYTMRIAAAGYECYHVGKSVAVHKRAIQTPINIYTDKGERVNLYLFKNRNELYYKRKYQPKNEVVLYLLYTFREMLHNITKPKQLRIIVLSLIKGMHFKPNIEKPAM